MAFRVSLVYRQNIVIVFSGDTKINAVRNSVILFIIHFTLSVSRRSGDGRRCKCR